MRTEKKKFIGSLLVFGCLVLLLIEVSLIAFGFFDDVSNDYFCSYLYFVGLTGFLYFEGLNLLKEAIKDKKC